MARNRCEKLHGSDKDKNKEIHKKSNTQKLQTSMGNKIKKKTFTRYKNLQ